MAFMALFGWMIPILLLLGAVKMVLEHIFGPLEPLLKVLLQPAVFNIAVSILLAGNLAGLAVLLAVRARWKRAGRLDRDYISGFRGWRRLGLAMVRSILTLGAVWEGVVVLACVACLVFQPLRYLPEPAPDSGTQQVQQHPYFGTWAVTACIGTSPSCTLSREEIDACIGTAVTYVPNTYSKSRTARPPLTGIFTSGGVTRPVVSDTFTNIEAVEFEALCQLSVAELGVETPVVTHITLELEGAEDAPLGQERFDPGYHLVWTRYRGAFFQMERV